MFLSVILILTLAVVYTSFTQPSVGLDVALENAKAFANPPDNAQLQSRPDLYFDKYKATSYWRITWNVNDSSIQVEVDNYTGKVIYYHDFSRQISGDLENLNVSSDEALQKTFAFIEEKAVMGLVDSITVDAVYQGTEFFDSSKSWVVTWSHIVNDVLVRGDRIIVKVNPWSSTVRSFVYLWRDVTISTKPEITKEKAVDLARSYMTEYLDRTLILQTISLQVVHPNFFWTNPAADVSQEQRLAWVSTTSNEHRFIEFWIDAKTGELVGGTTTLGQEAANFSVNIGLS